MKALGFRSRWVYSDGFKNMKKSDFSLVLLDTWILSDIICLSEQRLNLFKFKFTKLRFFWDI